MTIDIYESLTRTYRIDEELEELTVNFDDFNNFKANE